MSLAFESIKKAYRGVTVLLFATMMRHIMVVLSIVMNIGVSHAKTVAIQ